VQTLHGLPDLRPPKDSLVEFNSLDFGPQADQVRQ
jgi:hypothetical protein